MATIDKILAKLKQEHPDAKDLFNGLKIRCGLGEVQMRWECGIGRMWNEGCISGSDGEKVVLDELRRFVIQTHLKASRLGKALGMAMTEF